MLNEECIPDSPVQRQPPPEDSVMTEIIPHVWVGNANDAQNRDRLCRNNITHIVNCTPDLPCKWEDKYRYLRVKILDLPSEHIIKYFNPVSKFIDEAVKQNGNVLVHCSAGISRSPTFVLSYMIQYNNMHFQDAYTKMQSLRKIVAPNVSFLGQLLEFEKRIHSSSSQLEENKCPSASASASASASSSTSSSCSVNRSYDLDDKTKKTPIVTF